MACFDSGTLLKYKAGSRRSASAPPMAPELVRQVFEAEFGKPPERLFKRFDSTPFAAASIGQVHRAELHDGTPVAVKVQYPGVREAISADLANLDTIFNLMAIQARGFEAERKLFDLGLADDGEVGSLGGCVRCSAFRPRAKSKGFDPLLEDIFRDLRR